MKRLTMLLLALLLVLSLAVPAFAAESSVTYYGDAEKFVFLPGTRHSPTDLFPDFKNVMPGDTMTQKLTLRRSGSLFADVKIYIRCLGATENADFLNEMSLMVKKSNGTVLFNAPADKTAQLTEWTEIATLTPFSRPAEIEILLTVPTSMGNEHQDAIGKLQWQFLAEEIPIQFDNPRTGDLILTYAAILVVSGAALATVIFFVVKRRKKK